MSRPALHRVQVEARRRPRTSTWYVRVLRGGRCVYQCDHGHHTERSACRCGKRRLTQMEADVR